MDCPHIPELQYGAFSRRLHDKVIGQRIPITGTYELTLRCNLHCQHCYLSYGHKGLPGERELSAIESQHILDQVAEAGCLWLLLTGGEPLLRRDFKDIYLYAKRKGFLVSLFTNGTLLTPRLADLLAEWRPFVVEISLYGHTQKTYELVTGVPGSYARCRRGIELLLERQVPLKLKTILMTLNEHELDDMRSFAESLGVDFRFDPMISLGYQGYDHPGCLRLTPERVVQHDLGDAKRMQTWKQFFERFRGLPANPQTLFQCGAGISAFHIDPYGGLSLCMIARTPSYDLRQGSFRQGWEEFLQQARFQTPQGEYACAQCELLSICGQCPGWAILEHQNPQRPVEFLCQVAKLRAQTFEFD